jgi:hypothetical protein
MVMVCTEPEKIACAVAVVGHAGGGVPVPQPPVKEIDGALV